MIAIFGSFSYWGDNGITWAEFAERGTLDEVVEATAQKWFTHKEALFIDEAIGIPADEVYKLIINKYEQLVQNDKTTRRIQALKINIRNSEHWLANCDAEKARLTQLLIDSQNELIEITTKMKENK